MPNVGWLCLQSIIDAHNCQPFSAGSPWVNGRVPRLQLLPAHGSAQDYLGEPASVGMAVWMGYRGSAVRLCHLAFGIGNVRGDGIRREDGG